MAIDLPPNALLYIPVLSQEIDTNWQGLNLRSSLASQIEQESCVSLKSKMCWNPKAELKTSREYGFGLSQLTVAYDAEGKERFNNFTVVKQEFSAQLGSWKWEDRFNPKYQLITQVLFVKKQLTEIKFETHDEIQKLAFTYSAYNGGFGGVLQDRTLCNNTVGCDPTSWFSLEGKLGVKDVSFKSKIKVKGYGQSFYEVNRNYVNNVLLERRPKYDLSFKNRAETGVLLNQLNTMPKSAYSINQ